MSFPNVIHGTEGEAHNTYTTVRLAPVNGNGQFMVTEDGRVYRFAENAAVALVGSKCTQMEVPSTDTLEEAVGTMVAGDSVVTGVGSTSSSPAINELVDGFFWSLTAADLNPALRIKSNTLITAGSETGTITPYNALPALIAETSTISYIKNMWKDVIITLAPNTAPLTGVANVAVAASSFGWLQTRGVCRILVEDVPVIGEYCAIGIDDGGAVDSAPDSGGTANVDTQHVGVVINIGSDTTYGLIFLIIE